MRSFPLVLSLVALAFTGLLAPRLRAQAAQPPAVLKLPGLLYTNGTSTVGLDGQRWCYVQLAESQPGWLKSRTLTVIGRSPAQPGVALRLGQVRPVTDQAAIKILLQRADRLRGNLAEISGITNGLLDQWTTPGSTIGPSAPLENRLAAVIQRGLTDDKAAEVLRQLSRAHPAFALCFGQGWAGVVPGNAGAAATIELHEAGPGPAFDPILLAGSVTLALGQPTALPASGAPVQVNDETPEGDLTIKLRWSVPNALREQSMLTLGFYLYRLDKAWADANPSLAPASPTAAQLAAAVQANAATAVLVTDRKDGSNPGVVLVKKLFTAGDVANFTADPSTFFYADDNRRDTSGTPFVEGAQYYYHTVPLDLLRQPGVPSARGLGTAVRRLPPEVPGGVRVENVFVGGAPHLKIIWDANVNAGADVTTQRYEILRGNPDLPKSLAVLETDVNGLPAAEVSLAEKAALLAQLTPIATVNQFATPDGTLFKIDDTWLGPGLNGKTVWYALRAVHDNPAGFTPVRSRPSPPAFGVLRDFTGPTGPTNTLVDVPCPRVALAFGTATTEAFTRPAGDSDGRLRVTCTRQTPDVDWAKITISTLPISGGAETAVFESPRLYFGSTAKVTAEALVVTGFRAGHRIAIESGTTSGRWSGTVGYNFGHTQTVWLTNVRQIKNFITGLYSPLNLNPTTPLGQSVFDPASEAFSPQGPGPNGTMSVSDAQSDNVGRQVLVQRRVSAFASYVSLAICTQQQPAYFFLDPSRVSVPGGAGFSYRRFFLTEEPLLEDGPPPPCDHLVTPTNTAINTPLMIGLVLTPGTASWRIYRQIDGGPLTLLQEGNDAYTDGAANAVVYEDQAFPPTSALVCYFGQLIDGNGNPGTLEPLGPCKKLIQPPPTPVLNAPLAQGTAAAPQMKVSWFCPRPGVERFELFLAEKTASTSARPTSATMASLIKADGTYYQEPKGTPTPGAYENPWPYASATVVQNVALLPQHEAVFAVALNVEYSLWVVARGIGGLHSPPSLVQKFSWKLPPPQGEVAWPARPLPPLETKVNGLTLVVTTPPVFAWTDRVIAGLQNDADHFDVTMASPIGNWAASPDNYPVALVLGEIPLTGSVSAGSLGADYAGTDFTDTLSQQLGIGSRNFRKDAYFTYYPPTVLAGRTDPNSWLYRRKLSDGSDQSIFPAVLYRRMLSREGVTVPEADLIQVSPLIKSIAWKTRPASGGEREGGTFLDRFVVPLRGVVNDVEVATLSLLDTHPVVEGCRYEYFFAHFTEDGEIRAISSLGSLTIPTE